MLKVCIRLELSMGIDIYEMPVTTSDILEDIQLLRLRLIDASPHLCLSGIGNVNAPRRGALQQETTSCRRKPHACTGCAVWIAILYLAEPFLTASTIRLAM